MQGYREAIETESSQIIHMIGTTRERMPNKTSALFLKAFCKGVIYGGILKREEMAGYIETCFTEDGVNFFDSPTCAAVWAGYETGNSLKGEYDRIVHTINAAEIFAKNIGYRGRVWDVMQQAGLVDSPASKELMN